MPLFLLTLKAGGVGLNLTAADYVLLFDPWWNEAVENQAIDRAHRIGRKSTVIAKRYLAVGSIEEKMLDLKGEKRNLANALLDNGESFDWTEESLLHLFSPLF
jgi:SNF2 family DNA or RNA helicase